MGSSPAKVIVVVNVAVVVVAVAAVDVVAAVVVVVVVFVIVVVADADAVDVDVVFVIIVFLSCLLFSCSYGCRTSNPKIVGSSPAKDWPHTRVGGSSRRLLNKMRDPDLFTMLRRAA